MKTINLGARLLRATLACVPLVALLHAGSAQAVQFAYVPPLGTASTSVTLGTYLIDWQAGQRARVVSMHGAGTGSVAGTLAQRVVALDGPLSRPEDIGEPDSCGEYVPRRVDITHLVVRPLRGDDTRGSSQIVEMGKVVTLEGCDAGQERPFGATTDAGVTLERVAMALRPLPIDLLPGTRLAGFSDLPWEPNGDPQMAIDIVTLYAGGQALFQRSGQVVPAQWADRWLRLSLPTFDRAYTRLMIDDATGAETWLRAEWVNGQPQRVWATLVVKVADSAGFGTAQQASRLWEAGLFSATPQPFFVALYQGGSGERISKDLTTGTESRSPITWAMAGKNIQQTRQVFEASIVRTWMPLRNHGSKVRFVMEIDFFYGNDGSSGEWLAPRINFYIDRGPAVPQ